MKTAIEQLLWECDFEDSPIKYTSIVAAREEYAKLRSTPAPQGQAVEALLEAMTNAFLRWPLPPSVCADGCASMSDYRHPRSGTNLLTHPEAKQMFREVVLPLLSTPPAAHDAPAGEATDTEIVDYMEQFALYNSRNDWKEWKFVASGNPGTESNLRMTFRDSVRAAMRATQQPKEDGK